MKQEVLFELDKLIKELPSFYADWANFAEHRYSEIPGLEIVSDESERKHDSYGNSDHQLMYIFSYKNVLIALKGTYQSYNGYEWEPLCLVEPKEIVHTVYEVIDTPVKMKKLNAKEILQIVEENYLIEDFASNWLDHLSEKSKIKGCKSTEEILYKLGLGKVEEVQKYGGEGKGETWYSVKHFIDHDVFIKTNGYYQSYVGVEFYDGYGEEVKPQEKTITVYQ